MFFFFVGGLEQQAGRVLKPAIASCINCGSKAVDLVEYQKVLKLFFVPVWRWPGKDPLLHCRDCNLFYPPSFSLPPNTPQETGVETLRCRSCAGAVEPEFRFCPLCGSAL